MNSRSFKYYKFRSGSANETAVIPLNPGGQAGVFSLYTRKISGSGSATLAVDGAFKSNPAANDKFAVQSATSVGSGALTNILGTSREDQFPYLSLTLARTGTIEVDVYVTLL
jgi:hypothetical protein